MDCRTAQRLIDRYISRELSIQELHDFLDHIDSCPACYNELETYFIVYNAARRLDSDDDSDFNIHNLLQDDLARRHRRIHQYRFAQWLVILLLVAVTVFVGANILGVMVLV